jgi:hypothetical protein
VNTRTGRIALIVVGVVCFLMGAVFAGQGANLIPGSFMTGDRTWLVIGLVVAVGGLILVGIGVRRPKGDGSGS